MMESCCGVNVCMFVRVLQCADLPECMQLGSVMQGGPLLTQRLVSIPCVFEREGESMCDLNIATVCRNALKRLEIGLAEVQVFSSKPLSLDSSSIFLLSTILSN